MISNELRGEYEKRLIKASVLQLKLEIEAFESQIRQHKRTIKFIKEQMKPLKIKLKQEINNLTTKKNNLL